MRLSPSPRVLPFRAGALFAIAADIERYPEFLAGWRSARILSREDNVLKVRQSLGLGPLHLEFESRALLHPPTRIEVCSEAPPFALFRFNWLFEPIEEIQTQVSVQTEVEMRSRLAQHAVNALLPGAMAEVLSSFDNRARTLLRESPP